jgi:hypothetical protein
MSEYSELIPYQFASNSPIEGIDLDELEFYYTTDEAFLYRPQMKLKEIAFFGYLWV